MTQSPCPGRCCGGAGVFSGATSGTTPGAGTCAAAGGVGALSIGCAASTIPGLIGVSPAGRISAICPAERACVEAACKLSICIASCFIPASSAWSRASWPPSTGLSRADVARAPGFDGKPALQASTPHTSKPPPRTTSNSLADRLRKVSVLFAPCITVLPRHARSFRHVQASA